MTRVINSRGYIREHGKSVFHQGQRPQNAPDDNVLGIDIEERMAQQAPPLGKYQSIPVEAAPTRSELEPPTLEEIENNKHVLYE